MDRLREFSLDLPGSASGTAIRHAGYFSAIIVLIGILVVVYGSVQLPAYPQFATFHAGFVLLADTVTALLLFGQFAYRRSRFYSILASAYLFNALIVILFLLTFPGALKTGEGIVGDAQSAVWVWHFWHILFPAIVIAALFVQAREFSVKTPNSDIKRNIIVVVSLTTVLVLVLALAVTLFHDSLPVLLAAGDDPLTQAFYFAGSVALVVSFIAFLMAVRWAKQRRALHLWVAVALIALMADIVASLGANARYTVGWYFGRVESMVAASVLLVVLIKEINHLYFRLSLTMRELVHANTQLSALVTEKEGLVAELRNTEEQIRNLAYHDAVTDLANRWLLMERLEHAMVQGRRYHRTAALLFLDLDNFKPVNDSYGHDVGDALLKSVAHRLEACIREGDTASRIGGDEFVVLLPEISKLDDAVAMAEKILVRINTPFEVKEHRLEISTSIGIAVHVPEVFTEPAELLQQADAAMYAAKRSGRNRYHVSEAVSRYGLENTVP